MSEENAELVREGYRRFVAGENPPEWYAPDFVWDMSTFEGWPEKMRYEGYAGMMEFLANWVDAWDEWRLEPEEIRPAEDGRVVAIVRQYGRSKTTGLETEMRFAQVWTLRDGRYTRMEMYSDPEQALKATGIQS